MGEVSANRSGPWLRRTEERVADVDGITQHLGQRVGLAGVLSHLDRRASSARVPGRAAVRGFRWDREDQATERWWPQGITTSADASDTEEVHGHRLVVTSWYAARSPGHDPGSRVSIVDLDTLRYQHVLLVVPESVPGGEVALRPLGVHAGGLVWHGAHLHVAGTRRGLFSCRWDDLLRVDSPDRAWGHRFVLPVRFTYSASAPHGVEPMRYSFLSLDRDSRPPALVAGEYGRGEMSRRLVRFPLDPTTSHLTAGDDGVSRPVELDPRGPGHMQGACVVEGTYYVTTSRGRCRRGHLHVGRPGEFRTHPRVLPVGPEDICYWPSTDELWSLTEYPGRRFVFAMDRGRFGGPR